VCYFNSCVKAGAGEGGDAAAALAHALVVIYGNRVSPRPQLLIFPVFNARNITDPSACLGSSSDAERRG
jgi:hypothetical protein